MELNNVRDFDIRADLATNPNSFLSGTICIQLCAPCVLNLGDLREGLGNIATTYISNPHEPGGIFSLNRHNYPVRKQKYVEILQDHTSLKFGLRMHPW